MTPTALDDEFVRMLIVEPDLFAVARGKHDQPVVDVTTIRGDEHAYFYGWVAGHYELGIPPEVSMAYCTPWPGMREWIVGHRNEAAQRGVERSMRLRDEHGTPLVFKAVVQRLLAREGEDMISRLMTAETGFDLRVFRHQAIVKGRKAVAVRLEGLVGAGS